MSFRIAGDKKPVDIVWSIRVVDGDLELSANDKLYLLIGSGSGKIFRFFDPEWVTMGFQVDGDGYPFVDGG